MGETIEGLTYGVSPLVCAGQAECAAEQSRIDGTSDADRWAAATKAWEAAGDPYVAAYARWREAEALLVAGGRREKVTELARDAHQVASELGAHPLRAQLENLGQRARISLQREAPRPVAASAFAHLDLTPREIEVLALLGDGMTNRDIGSELFITSKTASVHVSRILSKLAVPNRAAAAAAAQRLGVTRHSRTTPPGSGR
jgi:DNA-binding CsgD family transcriptional regulator